MTRWEKTENAVTPEGRKWHKNGLCCYCFDVFINLETKNPKTMATLPKSMNIIKQVLTGHKNALFVRRLADIYIISPAMV